MPDDGVLRWFAHQLHPAPAPAEPAAEVPEQPAQGAALRRSAGWNDALARFAAKRAGRYAE